MRTTRPLTAVVLAGLSLTLVLGACGDDDEGADAPAGAPAAAGVLEVEASDFHFGGLPHEVAAGTRLELVNTSNTELHELVAIKLPDDETRPVEELLALAPAEQEALLSAAPPAVVLLRAPGEAPQVAAVGDGTLSDPGRYLVLCAIPTGVDPAAYLAAAAASNGGPPDVPGGPPHFTHGMFAELVVS